MALRGSCLPRDFETISVNGNRGYGLFRRRHAPSLLDPAALAKILDTLRRTAYNTDFSEVTLEADPETITAAKSEAWIGAGFKRISLGSQSFDHQELRTAGRMHRRADIFQASTFLRDAGFHNISMDLIAGIARIKRTRRGAPRLTNLLSIHPVHISIYMLEIDEGSRLGRESLAGGIRYSAASIPRDDEIAEFYGEIARTQTFCGKATGITKSQIGRCQDWSRSTT